MGQEKQKAPAGGENRMSRRTGMLLLLLLFAVLTALAVLVSSGALGGLFTSRTTTVEQSEVTMDTVASLTATGPEAETQAAVDESMERLRELDALAGTGPDSDVSRLAAAAGNGEWVSISPEVYHMLSVARECSERTGGAFDVTTGPLVALWGIGTDAAHVPAEADLEAARALVDYRALELGEDGQSARLRRSGMSVDLGAVAKGYALDELRRIYEKHHIENGLINLGASSIYALGNNDKGTAWRVGIRNPRGNGEEDKLLGVTTLSGQALSTSGDYERFFEQDGVRYHHIFDPRTGAPAQNGSMSVTVVVNGGIEDAGLLSDLLTTAVFVLGPQEGQAFLDDRSDEVSGIITTQQRDIYSVHGLGERLSNVLNTYTLH